MLNCDKSFDSVLVPLGRLPEVAGTIGLEWSDGLGWDEPQVSADRYPKPHVSRC